MKTPIAESIDEYLDGPEVKPIELVPDFDPRTEILLPLFGVCFFWVAALVALFLLGAAIG